MRSQVGEVFPGPLILKLKSRDLIKSTKIPQQNLLDFLKENHPDFKRKDVLGVKLLEMSSKVEMIPG